MRLSLKNLKELENMELQLDRRISTEEFIQAIDLVSSSTRREDLLIEGGWNQEFGHLRNYLSRYEPSRAMEFMKDRIGKTKDNDEFLMTMNG